MDNYKSKEWLFSEYVTKKRTANDIAKTENKDAKTIWTWLKKLGIETRSRGGASSSGSFKKGSNVWEGKKHTDETKLKIRNARLKDGRVPYLKNGEHWLKNISNEKHPNWKGGLSADRQSIYASQEWCDAVKAVWKRDKAVCQRCGKNHNDELNRGNFHIHHIVSFMVRELRTDVNNLVLLCKDCHKFVHSKKNINKEFIGE